MGILTPGSVCKSLQSLSTLGKSIEVTVMRIFSADQQQWSFHTYKVVKVTEI